MNDQAACDRGFYGDIQFAGYFVTGGIVCDDYNTISFRDGRFPVNVALIDYVHNPGWNDGARTFSGFHCIVCRLRCGYCGIEQAQRGWSASLKD